MTEQNQDTRKKVSQVDYDKYYDREYAYLTWIDRLPSEEAKQKAKETMQSEYVVVKQK